jgi:NAD(P)-dependent dehydrogenase (short-subunit alcohol dehydrogenase family)
MTVNARGVFLCYKFAAEVMIKQGQGGRIVGASSIAGKQSKINLLTGGKSSIYALRSGITSGGLCLFEVRYQRTNPKRWLVTFVSALLNVATYVTLARELGKYNITVNAYAPGLSQKKLSIS